MKLTLEISLYPLDKEFKSIIKSFIEKLSSFETIKVDVNNVSTRISGDYDKIMDLLRSEVKPVLEAQPSVFVVKFLAGDKIEDE